MEPPATISSGKLDRRSSSLLIDLSDNNGVFLVTNPHHEPAWEPPEQAASGYLVGRSMYEQTLANSPGLAPPDDHVRAVTVNRFYTEKTAIFEEVSDGGVVYVVAVGPAASKPGASRSDYLFGLDCTDTEQVQYSVVLVPVDRWEMLTGTNGAAHHALGIGGDQ